MSCIFCGEPTIIVIQVKSIHQMEGTRKRDQHRNGSCVRSRTNTLSPFQTRFLLVYLLLRYLWPALPQHSRYQLKQESEVTASSLSDSQLCLVMP